MRVDFYFDFLSPFSYLANCRLGQIANKHAVEVVYHAIDLSKAKAAIGNVGPSNRDLKVKLDYLKVDLQRWADIYGISLKFPPNFNSARLNTGVYYPEAAGIRSAYVQFVFDRVWGRGIAPDDEGLLDEVARHFGWSERAFRDFVSGGDGLGAYDAATTAAIKRKVFGVPTMFFGEAMWWGNDRLFLLEQALKDSEEQAHRAKPDPTR